MFGTDTFLSGYARKDITNAVEVIGMCDAGISGKESVGAEHDRRVGVIYECRYDPVMQGGRIKESLDA